MSTENNNMQVFLNYRNAPVISEGNSISDAINKLGIEKIEVVFDGCGDSGQMEDITVFSKTEDQNINLNKIPIGKVQFTTGTQYNGDGTTTKRTEVREATFADIVEEICYNLLAERHGGWEINEGSYGTFTLDFINKKIHLEFNERIETVETSEIEFDFNGNAIEDAD